MLVKALMLPREQLVIAGSDESLESALKKIEDNNFLSIPVADGKVFIGSISKQKIFEEYFKGSYNDKQSYLEDTKIKDIFGGIIPRIDPNDPIERASRVLENFGIPFVAVVNEKDNFEGIITHYAIFHAFGEVFGINEGRRISVIVDDIPGQLAKLTDIITKAGGDIISIAVIDPKVKLGLKEIVVRVRIINFNDLIEKIEDAGFKFQ